MSQFNSTYKGRKVVVNFADAEEPWESLEGVEIRYCNGDDAGEEIDYNDFDNKEWMRLQEEVAGEFAAWQADSVMGWD